MEVNTMEIKHKTISDEVVSKFNAEEFISDYPYIIKNKGGHYAHLIFSSFICILLI